MRFLRHGADPIKLNAETLADAELWLSHYIAFALKKESDHSIPHGERPFLHTQHLSRNNLVRPTKLAAHAQR